MLSEGEREHHLSSSFFFLFWLQIFSNSYFPRHIHIHIYIYTEMSMYLSTNILSSLDFLFYFSFPLLLENELSSFHTLKLRWFLIH